MRSLQLVKYDLISIIKSYLTYVAIALVGGLFGLVSYLFMKNAHKVHYESLIPMINWALLFVGTLFVIKTITRDYSQGTIQLYMNRVSSRIGYVMAKVISIILIALIFAGVAYISMLLIQAFTKGDKLDGDIFLKNIWFYAIFLLFYGLVLFLLTLIVQKPAVIFTIGIFLIFIVPFIDPFLGLIPEWGEHIQDAMKYIPFSYLTKKELNSNIEFTNWQWFISIASIVVLFVTTLFYATKRDI
ncbi:phenol-soluble modulin export ABC transporter permease subunit PmtD [Staphylococcus lugdunensis]|uniref:phenol-soluble modulin export ABC transporter permease subunit PmtD n=1 Tax=Staphylococcus lugdunensis TaxID=28035 RepID=UPI002096441B|nr:hypothetical protein [Staphylococcus lugdunensis]MCO7042032.1 hypothetical protein [Staphylococcus lugdunensis]